MHEQCSNVVSTYCNADGPTGSKSTETVDVREQSQHSYDSSSGNAIVPTQVDKTTPCNKHNGYEDAQTGHTKQTNEASNITQDGSSGQVTKYDIAISYLATDVIIYLISISFNMLTIVNLFRI